MSEKKDLIPIEDRVLALQELETLFAKAVRQRELVAQYIGEYLKPDRHYYTVSPGQKPSLTKEGAELICLPHALKAHYYLLSGPEAPPADNMPYQIVVKCGMEAGGKFAGESIGSASSYITRKDGAHKPRQNDPGLCHNATLKMAQKSAYIAATLNATAASEFFTQDLEDDQTSTVEQGESGGHWCALHKTVFFKKGKMKDFAHPIMGADGQNTGDWCNEQKSPSTEETEEMKHLRLQRQLFALLRGEKTLALTTEQCVEWCKARGVESTREVSIAELQRLIAEANVSIGAKVAPKKEGNKE